MAAVGERHLVLIGLMGVGKTTVGRRCAALLGRPFVDVDALVETTGRRSVPEIFATDGEAAFRALERTALADACASPEPLVISCGGGAMGDPENRRRVRSAGCVVWLTADPATLARRVGGAAAGERRPLLAGPDDPAVTLERLASLRAPAYEAAAHLTLATAGRSVDDVAALVVEELTRCPA
ncbi:MAG: shikimate kinase [Actinomycetes bacterium]